LGRVLIVTSPNSASLQKVANDIARVFNENADKLGISKAEVSLSRVAKPSAFKDVDFTIVVMVFDPIYVKGYAFIVWSQKQQGKKVVLYTTVEGKIKLSYSDNWMIRDLSAIANSKYTAERLEEINMRVDRIIYHGTNTAKIKQFEDSRDLMREQLGLTEDDFVVGYIAGCYARKGHDRFAEVVNQIEKRDPSIKFVIVTQPNCASHYSSLQNVILIPRFGTMPEEEVIQHYYAFDLYAQASLAEGFGIPVLEALAAGLPVVHVDYNPLSEITTPEVSFRVPIRAINYVKEYGAIDYELHLYNTKEFADAILKAKEAVLENREKYKEIARKRAEEFDMHKTYNQFIEIYSNRSGLNG